MKKIFSINVITSRLNHLKSIISNILPQCDTLYINFMGCRSIINISSEKIKINYFERAGSELRFFNYNDCDDDTYYFTIDDDIIYPRNYANIMIENMKLYNNEVVCCVHGSNINLNKSKDFYKDRNGRIVYHFKEKLNQNTRVMIPGVGTSCFYKKNVKIRLEDFKTPNMSDVYVASFLKKQSIPIISIKRNDNWLIPIQTNDRSIWGNNPYEEIDKLINKSFK